VTCSIIDRLDVILAIANNLQLYVASTMVRLPRNYLRDDAISSFHNSANSLISSLPPLKLSASKGSCYGRCRGALEVAAGWPGESITLNAGG